jgi:hypothetical protein
MTRRELAFVLGALVALGACSSDRSSPRVSVSEGTSMPSGSAAPTSDQRAAQSPSAPASEDGTVNFGELDESSSDGLAIGSACLGESRVAEQIGLDIFIMLDTSASMLDAVPGEDPAAAPTTKWDAVRRSLEAFVGSPDVADIGIGLQYFPQIEADVPFSCDTSDQCGPVAGPCSNSLCVITESIDDDPNDIFPPLTFTRITDDGPKPCFDGSDCTGTGETCRIVLGECVAPPGLLLDAPEGAFLNMNPDAAGPLHSPLCSFQGDCAGLPGTNCDQVGVCQDQSALCSVTLTCATGSTCLGVPASCVNQTRCSAADYSTPAVGISAAPERAAAILASLESQTPNGLTPTGPALDGALSFARTWAEQNTERQVVTVLVTDGFPTECTPIEIPELAALARTASTAVRPVRTFVIGVFSDADLDSDGQARLDALATAGNTGAALIVNTAGDVTRDFLAALDAVRTTSLSCDFSLDADMLDFERVNLIVTDAGGVSTPLFSVGTAEGCSADERGWYYVRDAAGTPTQISACPGVCDTLQRGGATARLQVGCATLIR